MLVDTVGQVIASEVPVRLSAAELRAMALRQQQQIDSQHQLLAAKEQRLRFLKAQEARNVASVAEEEKLRRLRERVEAQESKLRQLRALRGQVDLQKTYNVTLNNDLDSIRALFSEKEKELSLAVAKVDALTRQLEELRRDRRGTINILSSTATGLNQQYNSPSIRELEKLRRELMYRNQLSLQQDARLHLQREALQQRQAELKSVDQRIMELQTRLQKRKASNLVQTNAPSIPTEQTIQQTPNQALLLQQSSRNRDNNKNALNVRPSNSVYPCQRVVPRGNIAAVEPFIHTPQNNSAHMSSVSNAEVTKQSLNKANGNLENPLAQGFKKLKLNLHPTQSNSNVLSSAESDESKLAQQKLVMKFSDSNDTASSTAQDADNQFSTNAEINECDSDKAGKVGQGRDLIADKENTQLTVYSTPLDAASKSIATAVSNTAHLHVGKAHSYDINENKTALKSKVLPPIPSGNLVVPPRKPISSVAPTSITQTLSKINKPKINMVAPSVILASDADKSRPALPPKPNKSLQSSSEHSSTLPTVVNIINKVPAPEAMETNSPVGASHIPTSVDNQPIKARPLTIKKQPLSEQPKLKSSSAGIKPLQYNAKRIEVSQSFLLQEMENDGSTENDGSQQSNDTITNEELQRSVNSSATSEEKTPEDSRRRSKHIMRDQSKLKLSRRVSFDPLALLLDASLEGELELVKKTAMQVANPSAANDEGITALHNAICAGHFEIVKFLVEFGCDVNAQDSDGWTPLHCAASCNNLNMVKFLVESGACLFASTLSDHETPAEKCEEDEEGFDGCSEYLYSIQEKLGILNGGEVYAVFSYDAQQADELSFSVNDHLIILRKGDDAEREWWWAKDRNDQEGYVPRNLLGLYPRVAIDSSGTSD